MFNSIISTELTPTAFLLCLGSAFILGLLVALVHQKTSHASTNFVTTLAVLPMLVTIAIILVNGNLGVGVATMGVFSLVRFRSIAGNSKSLLSVFFAMVIGLACGTGYIGFAFISTIIISVIIFILNIIKFGQHSLAGQKLVLLVPEDLDYTEIFDDVFENCTKSHILEKVKTTNMGSLFELKYHICLKPDVNEKTFIDQLRVKNGNLKVSLSHTLDEGEL